MTPAWSGCGMDASSPAHREDGHSAWTLPAARRLWSNAAAEFLGVLGGDRVKVDVFINATSAELLCTQDAVIFQPNGRKTMVALSPLDGHVLWSHEGFGQWGVHHSMAVDGKIYTDRGVLDPATGKLESPLRLRTTCSRIQRKPGRVLWPGGPLL